MFFLLKAELANISTLECLNRFLSSEVGKNLELFAIESSVSPQFSHCALAVVTAATCDSYDQFD